MVLWSVLTACSGPERVTWDEVGGDDLLDDAVFAVLLFGVREGDRDTLTAAQATGSVLRLAALPRFQDSPVGWSAETLSAEIARVDEVTTTDEALVLDLSFVRQGTTELLVHDATGTIVDVEVLRVRDPASVELVPYDGFLDDEPPLPVDEVHVAAGTDADLVLLWAASDGEPLAGGGLMDAALAGPADGLVVETVLGGASDVLHLDAAAAAPAQHELVLSSAGVEVDRRALVVHDRDEVDGVALDSVAATFEPGVGFTGGTLIARVTVGQVRLEGAEVWFRWGDREELGSQLEWSTELGDPTEVEACFTADPGEVCEVLLLPGTPRGATDPEPSTSSGCSCGHGPGPTGALGGLALAGVLSVRRRR